MHARSAERLRTGFNPHVVPKKSRVGAILSSPGECLDPTIRDTMQAQMGHDFSQVKTHTGPDAAESARAVGAAAFTVGQHIVFGSGAYAPATEQGQELLRHELTHTMQQPSISRVPDLQHTDPSDRFEVEAIVPVVDRAPVGRKCSGLPGRCWPGSRYLVRRTRVPPPTEVSVSRLVDRRSVRLSRSLIPSTTESTTSSRSTP